MSGTERTGPDRVHPIVGVLRDQGRTQTWLARRIGRSHEHTNRVLNGIHPALADFRAACALALGVPEQALFHQDGLSNGASARAETAEGSRLYGTEEALSIRQLT